MRMNRLCLGMAATGLLCIQIRTLAPAAASTTLPEACFQNVADYTYMCWANGLRDPSRVFDIQTSRYGLSFDYDAFQLTRFQAISAAVSEVEALQQDSSTIAGLAPASIQCAFEANGRRHLAVGAGPEVWDCRLVDSGKFFQRRWLDAIAWSPSPPAITSRLEIAAWPDRVAFNLHVTPTSLAISNGALEITLDLDGRFSGLLSNGNAVALSGPDGAGYVMLSSGAGTQLTVDAAGTSCKVRASMSNWAVGVEKVIGLIVYPVAGSCATALEQAAVSENSPLAVSVSKQTPVSYEPSKGWHRVSLPAGGFVWPDNNWMQRLTVTIANPSPFPRVARLNFSTDAPGSITGVSAMLRDTDTYPLGIPVQLSKNWHDAGAWFHGLTMLSVPAQSSISFEFTCVYAHWGGVAAASHAQLSLVGYPYGYPYGNQLWDQTAIGSWGESITFDPDVTLGRAMIDDVRPLMVWAIGSQTPTRWTWTNNVGGADFLVYQDASGQRRQNRRMRTRYHRYCPNLTEVTYAGQTDDGRIDLACTVMVYRTDDLVRGCYRVRYDVRQPVSFSRLAFFQMAADNYSDNQFNLMARGDENGLLEEWRPPWGGWYSRTGMPCTGQAPWFSLHDAISRDSSAYGAWANRGLVIRSWNARLGGQEAPIPYAAVVGTQNGYPSAAVELSAPPGVTQLLAGDYVEADIVQVVMPQFASDYYGPNVKLAAALAGGENTWRMIHREAAGNHVDVRVSRGTLEGRHPIRIRATAGGCADFDLTGGLAYVPITICGLSGYRIPPLQRKINGQWAQVDQSVYGNDFWQADYDPTNRTWEVTFTIPLDTPGDERATARFRLSAAACPPLLSPGDLDNDGDVDQSDFGQMQACLTGGFEWVAGECGDADLDEDGHVDETDLQVFGSCRGGAGVPIDPGCLPD